MRVNTLQEKYLGEVFGLSDDADLLRVRERMAEVGLERMSIAASEARILQFLVRGFGVKKIVEFGTLFGYSALAMAQALPADGRLYTLEKEPKHHAWAKETLRASPVAGDKIIALCGDANELAASLVERGPFDMVFIDANKTGYLDYLDWAEQNVRPGGLIVGDNTFLWGALWGEPQRDNIGAEQVRVMTEFNARLADPTRYNSILIPTVEGMTVAQRYSRT